MNARQKADVKAQAHGCCEYCWSQEEYSPDPFSVEHIIPLSRGGNDDLDNLAFACQGCNNRKYVNTQAIDPSSGELASLFHPRQDHWSAHFAWNDDYTLMIGVSATGRATVARLDLNRKGLVNLRRVLRAQGLHPQQAMNERHRLLKYDQPFESVAEEDWDVLR